MYTIVYTNKCCVIDWRVVFELFVITTCVVPAKSHALLVVIYEVKEGNNAVCEEKARTLICLCPDISE